MEPRLRATKIIFAPYYADGVGVFDPSDNSFVLVDITSTISDDRKFNGAATASDGKIIFAPYYADGVGVFDPSDNSFVLVDISSTISDDRTEPRLRAKISRADHPSDNSFVLVDITSTISHDWKFRGAATAIDGKIIFAPSQADGVGVFDFGQRPFSCNMAHISTNSIYNELTPSNLLVRGSLTLVSISSTISHDWKFRGAATASDGKIIFAPYYAGRAGGV